LGVVEEVYLHADFVDPYTEFNIGGGGYRLMVRIDTVGA
jgi:hypothetical protein